MLQRSSGVGPVRFAVMLSFGPEPYLSPYRFPCCGDWAQSSTVRRRLSVPNQVGSLVLTGVPAGLIVVRLRYTGAGKRHFWFHTNSRGILLSGVFSL